MRLLVGGAVFSITANYFIVAIKLYFIKLIINNLKYDCASKFYRKMAV
jgi:hypothetical protein